MPVDRGHLRTSAGAAGSVVCPCSFCRWQQLRYCYRSPSHVYAFAGLFIELVSRFVEAPYERYPIVRLGIMWATTSELCLARDYVVPLQGGVCSGLVGEK